MVFVSRIVYDRAENGTGLHVSLVTNRDETKHLLQLFYQVQTRLDLLCLYLVLAFEALYLLELEDLFHKVRQTVVDLEEGVEVASVPNVPKTDRLILFPDAFLDWRFVREVGSLVLAGLCALHDCSLQLLVHHINVGVASLKAGLLKTCLYSSLHVDVCIVRGGALSDSRHGGVLRRCLRLGRTTCLLRENSFDCERHISLGVDKGLGSGYLVPVGDFSDLLNFLFELRVATGLVRGVVRHTIKN